MRAGSNSRNSYLNIPASFDIEASSFYVGKEKHACMYNWQFALGEMVVMGRTWDEWLNLLYALHTVLELSEKKRLPIYVHNLGYEFQFIRKLIHWDKCFFTEPRKPLFCVAGGLEFRDSLKLAGGKSLAKIGEELREFPNLRKAVGELDYDKVRGPNTPLTEQELHYCEMDVRVLNAYIWEKMQLEGDNIAKIPYTNTGYVRRYVSNMCFKKSWYRPYIQELTLTPKVYELLTEAFSGGFTHANYNCVDLMQEDVGSFDKRSSYPSVMVTEKFPISRFRPVNWTNQEDFEKLCREKAVLFRLEMVQVYPLIDDDHILSLSKCRWIDGSAISPERATKLGIVVDNGRIVTAPYISITCTEKDYEILQRFYGCTMAKVGDIWAASKGYLPKPIVQATLKLFKDKTSLKGIVEELVNYMISKNMINAEYGMMVTSIIKEILQYDNEQGYLPSVQPDVLTELDKYNISKKRFLFWPWGVWITAYARYNLLRVVADCGSDHVYSDTDSDKILNPEEHLDVFKKYDDEIMDKIRASAEFFNIPVEDYMPIDTKGHRQIIGTWEYEALYHKFKTLGAKRYLVMIPKPTIGRKFLTRRLKTPDFCSEFQYGQPDWESLQVRRLMLHWKYAITVAGLPKGAVKYIKQNSRNPFEMFNSSLYIPAEDSGKLTLFYGDEPIEGEMTDYLGNKFHYHEESYIHAEKKHFTLDRSDQFAEFLLGFREVATEEF